MGGGRHIPLVVLLVALGGCAATPEPGACVAPCESLDAPPLLFGLDRFHFRMFESAAEPLLEAMGPGIKSTDLPEEVALMRSVEHYAWRDCVFRASFYFLGDWQARALTSVRLQIEPDASPACFAENRVENRAPFSAAALPSGRCQDGLCHRALGGHAGALRRLGGPARRNFPVLGARAQTDQAGANCVGSLPGPIGP